ncbi:hypothetical protein FA15DRAFT_263861 [Coprinopsis marcescibilis]|uniref:F-box domain-containing protein n=1 Tax=Coprinopsis marcescibilis TaxID=230819 RepID=A0A5C3L237_COPMA|nr:hypothetical protein FA15DRAFT_263861 [Coprinopsis marcescibilis]
MTLLGQFPGELYSHIISYIPDEEVQATVLSLTRVFPQAPIPLHHLYRRIRVRIPRQAVLLNRHLRKLKTSQTESDWLLRIHGICIESWDIDAEVVLNILKMLGHIQFLEVWIGPASFAPEHLQELLEKPFPYLTHLSLRFRPYVTKATYYQFHKGSYYDSTLQALASWPTSKISSLSVVQDLQPKQDSTLIGSSSRSFAQPLVFFQLDKTIANLLRAEDIMEPLKVFRLRVPARPIVRALTSVPFITQNSDGEPVQLPKIEIMDLSTCGVLEGEVDLLLVHFSALKHLILDGCSILGGQLREGEWNSMGKRCAMAGARRAKDCEKALTAWYERRSLPVDTGINSDPAAIQAGPRRARRGRRGLATATISLRSRTPDPDDVGPRPPFPSRGPASIHIPKFKILPPLPSLKTLCTTTSASVKVESNLAIVNEFEAGWAEGVAQLGVRRARMRETAKNTGTKIFRFVEEATYEPTKDEDWNMILDYAASHGLELVETKDYEAFDTPGCALGESAKIPIPVLCLAGSEADSVHVENCGHSVAADVLTCWPNLLSVS